MSYPWKAASVGLYELVGHRHASHVNGCCARTRTAVQAGRARTVTHGGKWLREMMNPAVQGYRKFRLVHYRSEEREETETG